MAAAPGPWIRPADSRAWPSTASTGSAATRPKDSPWRESFGGRGSRSLGQLSAGSFTTLFKKVQVDLPGRLLPSPLHAPFGYLADAANRNTRVVNAKDGAFAPSSVSACTFLGTPDRS